MSYAILARCARTGRVGLAVASESLGIGHRCAGGVKSNVGAAITLGSPRSNNNTLGMALLAQGFGAAQALRQLLLNDPEHERTHVALIDRSGASAAHAGTQVADSAAPVSAEGCVAIGHTLPASDVLSTLAHAFGQNPQEDLENRLLVALEATRAKGAKVKAPLRSVALIVFGTQDHSDIDLRVDLHDDPIGELRRIFDEYQPFAAYYLERGKHPRQAIPQKEFADMLYANRSQEVS